MGRRSVKNHTLARALDEVITFSLHARVNLPFEMWLTLVNSYPTQVKERMAALRGYVSWSEERIAYLEEEHDRLLDLRAREQRAALGRARRLRWLEAEVKARASAPPPPALPAPPTEGVGVGGVMVVDKGQLTPLGRLLLRAAEASPGALLEALAALGEAWGGQATAAAVTDRGEEEEDSGGSSSLLATAAASPTAATALVALGRHLVCLGLSSDDGPQEEQEGKAGRSAATAAALRHVLIVLQQWLIGAPCPATAVAALLRGRLCALLAAGLLRQGGETAKTCGGMALGLLRWEAKDGSSGGMASRVLVEQGVAEAAVAAIDGPHQAAADDDDDESGLAVVGLALLASLLLRAPLPAYTRLRGLGPCPRILATMKRGMADPGIRREGCRALAALAAGATRARGEGGVELLLLEGMEEATEVAIEAARVSSSLSENDEPEPGITTADRALALAVASLLSTLAASTACSRGAPTQKTLGYRDELLAAGAPKALLSLLRDWALDAAITRVALRALVCFAEGAAAAVTEGGAGAGAGAGAAGGALLLGRILLPDVSSLSSTAPQGPSSHGLTRRACRALLRFTPTDSSIRRDGCAALGLLLHYSFPAPPATTTPLRVPSPVLAAAAAGRQRAALLAVLVEEGAVRRLVEALLHCGLEAEAEAEAKPQSQDANALRRETVALAVRALGAVAAPPAAVVAAEGVDAGTRRRQSLALAGAVPALMAVVEGRAWGAEVGVAALRSLRGVVAAAARDEEGGEEPPPLWRLLDVFARLARFAVARILSPPSLADVSAAKAAAAAAAVISIEEPGNEKHHRPAPLAPTEPLAIEALTSLLTLSQAVPAAAPAILEAAGLYPAWLAALQHYQQGQTAAMAAAHLGDFMAALVLSAPTAQASNAHARAVIRAAASSAALGTKKGLSPLVVMAGLIRRVEEEEEQQEQEEEEQEEGARGESRLLEGLRRLHAALALAEAEWDEEEGKEEDRGRGAAVGSTSSSFLSLAALLQELLAAGTAAASEATAAAAAATAAAAAAAAEATAAAGAAADPAEIEARGRRSPSSVFEAAAGLLLPPGPLPGPAEAVGSALGSVPKLAWATVQGMVGKSDG